MVQAQVQTEVKVYYQPPPVSLEELDLGRVTQEAAEVISRLDNRDILSRDLELIKQHGITQEELATLFDVTKRSVQYWKEKRYKPRDISNILIIREIARCLRERDKAQREAALRPRLVRC